jgi:hypothetical protein
LKVFFAGFEGLRRPQIEEPPSEEGEKGPRGSPVWKEKFFCTEWMGLKL